MIALLYILKLKCPKCRKGDLFVKNNQYILKSLNVMRKRCSVCNLKYAIEPGFFFGATYISYALQIATAILTFLTSYYIFDLSTNWIVFYIVLIILILSPYYLVLSRSFWIYFFP